ncbi:MAG: class I SAM-dependent methyltransferase [Lentimicrobium sp.]|nr:class I SAM-dependent methyltransferase [Lentimicrobium sp.]
MPNPWLEIPYSDYENRMSEVGQSQILSRLFSDCLSIYKPAHVALPGCATGNGLEHISGHKVHSVHAVDINPLFLDQLRQRFAETIPGLLTYCIDLQNEELPFSDIDLIFCGLLLEYVNPEIVIPKMAGVLAGGGVIVLVIQQSLRSSFVTKTRFTSLEKLSEIGREIYFNDVTKILFKSDMVIVKSYDIQLNESKFFKVLACKKAGKD